MSGLLNLNYYSDDESENEDNQESNNSSNTLNTAINTDSPGISIFFLNKILYKYI